MKRALIALTLAAALGLGGCANLAAGLANVATSLSSSTPSQVTSLAEAQQAATLVTKGADAAVTSGKLNRATLLEINALSDGIHAAMGDLEAANAAGKSIDFAAFNAALSAYNSYMTANAISH